MSDAPLRLTDPRVHVGAGHDADPARREPALAPVPERTDLDDLVADISDEVDLPPVVFDLPHRPGYSLLVDVNLSYEQITALIGRSKNRYGQVDEERMALHTIAWQTREIRRDGRAVLLDGRPVGFGDPQFQQSIGVTDSLAAVRKLVGMSADVLAIGGAITTEAGYGQTVQGQGDRPDPTPGWSNG